MTTNGHETYAADARRRRIRVQVIFAGAAAVATLALFGAARPGDATTGVAMGSITLPGLPASAAAPFGPQVTPIGSGSAGRIVAVNDDDTNPSSGDIFTQNAQDQSTA